MKKGLLLILLLSLLFASGCRSKTDLTDYSFVNVQWERDTESCVETIRFYDDGTCSYYCGCGEPINNDDLCKGYSYNPKTKKIHLSFSFPAALFSVTDITVKSCDADTLVLDFDGDIRTFTRAGSDEAPTTQLDYKGKSYVYLECPADIFYYDLAQSVDAEEDEIVSIPHSKWEFVYQNGDLFVLESQEEEAIAYYGNYENYTWSVFIDHPDGEEATYYPISLTDAEIAYVFQMEAEEKNITLFFEDIEIFASLVRTSKDGLIYASTSLAGAEGKWYWRSEIIDDTTEGWPEYVIPLPEGIANQLSAFSD